MRLAEDTRGMEMGPYFFNSTGSSAWIIESFIFISLDVLHSEYKVQKCGKDLTHWFHSLLKNCVKFHNHYILLGHVYLDHIFFAYWCGKVISFIQDVGWEEEGEGQAECHGFQLYMRTRLNLLYVRLKNLHSFPQQTTCIIFK